MNPTQLSQELRTGRSPDLTRRRWGNNHRPCQDGQLASVASLALVAPEAAAQATRGRLPTLLPEDHS